MATACDKASLTLAAACFTCLSEKQLRAIRIYLKCNQLNGVNVSQNCSPTALNTAATAAGYLEMSVKQQMAVETYLDCQINSSGGGGGGAANYYANYGGGTPTPVPTSGVPIAVDSSTGATWVWSGAAWVKIIA